MLGKVLKYDIKAMGKVLSMIYAADICVAIVSKLAWFLATKMAAIQFLAIFIDMFFIFLMLATILFTLVISVKHFYTNMLRDEGYLTHTLPVKKSTLVNSKIIASFIFFVISILVIVISVAIAHYDVLNMFINAVTTQLAAISFPALPFLCVLIAIAYLIALLLCYTAMSIANLHNSNKLVFSAVYAIGLYMVSQIINVIALVTFILVNKLSFNANSLSILDQTSLVIKIFSVFGCIMAITIVVYYIVVNRIMNKRLNLE